MIFNHWKLDIFLDNPVSWNRDKNFKMYKDLCSCIFEELYYDVDINAVFSNCHGRYNCAIEPIIEI